MDPAVVGYLRDKRALIVEPSNSFSTLISGRLSEMGVDKDNITIVGSYAEAEVLVREGVQIVIAEYHVKKNFGLNLAPIQKSVRPNFVDRIFIIVTSNADESAVAEAAEEDVDGYILKPFSPGKFEESLSRIVKTKLTPSEYWQYLQTGQELMKFGEFRDAMEAFINAEQYSDKPSLACYYQGQAHSSVKEDNLAIKDYQRGLSITPMHYKCLQGEFEVLFRQNKREEAYRVARKIKAKFPITPQRLSNFFLLAVYTFNFDDLDNYFETFSNYENRPLDLCRLVSAGMMAAGKYVLKEGRQKKAFECFRKANIANAKDIGVLEKVIDIYVKQGDSERASYFLKRIPNDMIGGSTHSRLEFLVFADSRPIDEVSKLGKQVIAIGGADFRVYDKLIKIEIKRGKKLTAEDFVIKAVEDFPDKRNYFYDLLESE